MWSTLSPSRKQWSMHTISLNCRLMKAIDTLRADWERVVQRQEPHFATTNSRYLWPCQWGVRSVLIKLACLIAQNDHKHGCEPCRIIHEALAMISLSVASQDEAATEEALTNDSWLRNGYRFRRLIGIGIRFPCAALPTSRRQGGWNFRER